MDTRARLAGLPLLPRDTTGPVFREPWEAQGFATVVELIDTGQITQKEWAERLAAVLRDAESRGEYDTGERYYEHWLRALEDLVVEKNMAGTEELDTEREVLRAGDHHRREEQLGHAHGHEHTE